MTSTEQADERADERETARQRDIREHDAAERDGREECGQDVTESAALSLGTRFWRLWTSAALSSLADGIVKVALPLIAITLTRSPTLIAGLTIAFTGPWLLFALPVGALVDRMDRRRTMLVADVVRSAMAAGLVLTALAHLDSIWALYALAFGTGVAETFYDTAAQSILPQLVGRDLLSKANGRLYGVEMAGREFVGPPLAGVLVAAGAVVAYLVPMALWVFAVVALLALRGNFRVPQGVADSPGIPIARSLRAEIAEGLGFLWRNRILRTFTMMIGAFNFASSAAGAVFVLYAVGAGSPMGLNRQQFGLLLAVLAAGSVAGTFVARRVERALGKAHAIIAGELGALLFIGAPAVTVNVYGVGAAFFVGGMGIMVLNIIVVSLRQQITPDRLLGRLNSAHRLVAWGTQPLGAAVGGVLAQVLGLRAVFGVTALIALAVLVVAARIITEKALDAAQQAAPPESAAPNEPSEQPA